MEDITDSDYNAKSVCKDFKRKKKVGEYHDFYIKSNSLLLANVFQKIFKNLFRNLSIRSFNFFYFNSRS